MSQIRLDVKKEIDFYIGGLLVFLLYIPVRILGLSLKRNHHLVPPKHITIIKLLGGGSLLLALPALLAIRKKYPDCRFSLVCSHGIRSAAESLKIFDDVRVIDDRGVGALLSSALGTWIWMLRNCETVIDLEVHSKLTTIYSTISMARNRIGFYDKNSEWRKRIYTHSIYFNVFNSVYEFYDGIACLFECTEISIISAREHLESLVNSELNPELKGCVALGVGCSDLSLERQWPVERWIELLQALKRQYPQMKFVFLGGPGDFAFSDRIASQIDGSLNFCGKLKLMDSVSVLRRASLFLGIDSMLLHFGRMLQVPSVSLWGPTRPHILLRPGLAPEYASYSEISCSPCVHITEKPPCRGQNICMQSHRTEAVLEKAASLISSKAISQRKVDRSGIWVVDPNFSILRCEIDVIKESFS